jgi:hypothetical protein
VIGSPWLRRAYWATAACWLVAAGFAVVDGDWGRAIPFLVFAAITASHPFMYRSAYQIGWAHGCLGLLNQMTEGRRRGLSQVEISHAMHETAVAGLKKSWP